MNKQKQMKEFPAKQPFERGLEALLKKYKCKARTREYTGTSLMTQWNTQNLMINYFFDPIGYKEQDNTIIYSPKETVYISPTSLWGKDCHEDLDGMTISVGYIFDFKSKFLMGMDSLVDLSYPALFPNYRGPLDDEHTARGKIPTITREEFVKELEKILKYSE